MNYVVDRIEAGVAICNCLPDGKAIEVETGALPPQTKEGDVLAKIAGKFVFDEALTQKRRAELTARMNRLFDSSP